MNDSVQPVPPEGQNDPDQMLDEEVPPTENQTEDQMLEEEIPATDENQMPKKDELDQLFLERNPASITELGGVERIMTSLRTSRKIGVHGNKMDLRERRRLYGSNTCRFGFRTFIQLVFSMFCSHFKSIFSWITYLCIVYFLILGLVLLVSPHTGLDDRFRFHGGGVALIFIVYELLGIFGIFVEGISYIWYFRNSPTQLATVLRNGGKQKIPFEKIVVGEIVCLSGGETIPADGILLECPLGFLVASGELSEGGPNVQEMVSVGHNSKLFLCSGCKVKQGNAKMLVICVGKNDPIGYEKRKSITYPYEKTELCSQFISFSKYRVRYVEWIVISLLLSSSSLYYYFSGHAMNKNGQSEYIPGHTTFLEALFVIYGYILAIVVTLIHIIVKPFRFAVRVTFNLAEKYMATKNVIIKDPAVWERLGFGFAMKGLVNDNLLALTSKYISASTCFGIDTSADVDKLIQQSICFNTTGIARFVGYYKSRRKVVLSGVAVMSIKEWKTLNQSCKAVRVDDLADQQAKLVILEVKDDDKNTYYHIHKRGPAKSVVKSCMTYYDASGLESQLDADGFWNSVVEKNIQVSPLTDAFAHARISKEEYEDDPGLKNVSYTLLGFLEVKLVNVLNGEEFPARVSEDYGGDVENQNSTRSVDQVSVSVHVEEDQLTAGFEISDDAVEGYDETSTNDEWSRHHIVIFNGDVDTIKLIRLQAFCVLRNIQASIQFLVTTHTANTMNTFIWLATTPSGIPTRDKGLIIKLVQFLLLRPGLIFIATWAYARQKPDSPSQEPPPLMKAEEWKLVTGGIWTNISAQIAYQVFVMTILQLGGSAIFGSHDMKTRITVTFVTSIFMQVLNMINARKMEEKNIFSGICWSFVGIVALLMVVPFGLVEALHHSIFPESILLLDLKEWVICFGLAMGSWLVNFIVKCSFPCLVKSSYALACMFKSWGWSY